jgi:hypothetical protein
MKGGCQNGAKKLGDTGNAKPRHIIALLSAPPITLNWKRRKATTIVAPAETAKMGNASGAKIILRAKTNAAPGPYTNQNLLEISLVLRSLSDAAMKTPTVKSNAAKSNEGGTVGFIRSRNLPSDGRMSISLLEPALVTLGTSQQ